MTLRDLVRGLAAGIDEGVVGGARLRRRLAAQSAERLGPEERIARLHRLAERYDRPEWRDPDAFFPVPAIDPREASVRAPYPGVEAVDLLWDRAYDPIEPEVGQHYLAHRDNLRFAARWLRAGGDLRPTVVLLHGYLGGRFEWEQRVFPVRRLLAAGFDVVMPALPFHGPRRAAGVSFPAADPRWTIEGFRHAVTDLRALVGLLRTRGAPRVGVWGMSLGGYTTALLATTEPLDFAVPIIPLASIGDYALQHGRFVGTPDQIQAQHVGLEAVYRVASPLARPSRVPGDRMIVIAGRGDRITGPAQAARLAEHFECPLDLFEGGHLLQIGLRRHLGPAFALSADAP